jgi:hypothetical protein
MHQVSTQAVASPSCQTSYIVVYFTYAAYTISQFVLAKVYGIYGHIDPYTYIYVYIRIRVHRIIYGGTALVQMHEYSCICTYNLVRMPPRKTRKVLKSWYSDDGGSAAHSGDDRAPGLAAVPAVCLASGSVRNPVALPYVMPSLKSKKQEIRKPEKQHFAYMVQQSSPCQEAVVVARTRVMQPRQGMGKRPFGITSTGDQSITLVILFNCTNLHSFAAG